MTEPQQRHVEPPAGQAPVIAIVGPTASGKSSLALDIADSLGGPEAVEIVGADAFQLYRGMDIGTAKLPPSQRRGYRHHQIDVIEPGQDSSVARYQQQARGDIAAARSRGARVIVVGGSGLYVRALLDDMNFPGTDPQIRAKWEQRAEEEGLAALYTELAIKDPTAARSIDPANGRRIIRALEVIDITDEPFSANLPRQEYVTETVQIGIDYGRQALDERIAQRVAQMWQDGLLAEVQRLAGPELNGLSQTALRAVGYRETVAHLAGRISAAEAREQIIAATRRLSRKQMGWFGRDPRINWIRADQVTPDELVRNALTLIADADDKARHDQLALSTEVPSALEPIRRRLGS